MRFNGTTVPTNRDDTYTTKETNRDIQTGRAVYADKDKYENDEAYKANIDKYVAEGFHLIFGTPDQPSEGGGSSGGGGGAEPLLVTITGGTLEEPATMDKTWQEICDAFPNIAVYKGHPDGTSFIKTPIIQVSKTEQSGYSVVTPDPMSGSTVSFTADSASDYPVLASD